MRNTRRVLLVASIVLCCSDRVSAAEPPFWPCEANDGAPYGRLTDSDADTLVSVASASGLELGLTLKKVYAGDQDALAMILRFSSQLKTLDMPARAYGNLVYSIFVNLGEARGTDFVTSVIVLQEPAVQERIRDFLWYPIFCIPEERRAEVEQELRADHPSLWPPEFAFGEKDSLFSKTPNNTLEPLHSSDTPPAE